MDIHKPHAAKTWREFFIELGTIVAGILIALSLEQAAESIRHHAHAKEARETIRSELTINLTRVNNRAQVQACVDHRLTELKALLDGPDGRIGRLTAMGQPPRYGIDSNRWNAASNSGRVSLLGAEEQGAFGFLYLALDYYYAMENGEQLVWARLHALESTDRLTPDGLLAMRSALEEARFYNWSIGQVATIVLDRAGQVGVRPRERPQHDTPICAPMTIGAASGAKP